MVELRRLRYFLAVAGERNFTRAAELLHVAQPALSRQVRLFEQELGVELVRRTTHTFELTEAGQFLYERGPALLDSADALWRTLGRFGSGERGRLVVAYGTSAGYDTAPRLLQAIGVRLPELEVVTRVLSAAEIEAGIADGSIDVGVVRCPPQDGSAVESRLLRLESQGVLLRSDHRLAATDRVRLADLEDEAVLLHPRDANPGHYDAVVALLRDAGVEPRLVVRNVSFDVAQTPVVEGRAVAIVGESSRTGIPPELRWLELDPPRTLEVRLLARWIDRAPALGRFLDVAEEVADELEWRDPPPGADDGHADPR